MCRATGLEQQPGVAVGAMLHDHHVAPAFGSMELAPDAADVAPGASIPGVQRHSTTPVNSRDVLLHPATDGHLVDPSYHTQIQGMVGAAVVPGAKRDQEGVAMTASVAERSPKDQAVVHDSEKPKNQGLLSKIRNALH
jgi:hypothetical protein